MKWFYRLEFKYGRFAIRNLMRYLVMLYVAGLVIMLVGQYSDVDLYARYLCLNPEAVMQGQVWRLLTFIICPPSADIFFGLLGCYVYWMLGEAVERAWGAFKFNVYMFAGILFSAAAVMIAYAAGGNPVVLSTSSTIYLNFSLFMAFAFTYPNVSFYFMFIIPIRAQVMAVIELCVYIFLFLTGNLADKVMIGVSLLNFLIFFFLTRNVNRFSPKEIKRRTEFKRAVRTPVHQTRHRCAVCGVTEKDGADDLEFRYCSKCEGSFEYCSQHLYTHIHVTPEALKEMKHQAGMRKTEMPQETKMVDSTEDESKDPDGHA